ncbi:GntR family transcriptional regulator [Aquincola sp. MAHUQ-54]|uniref:GntR family transcriptional regulator n=1 Tax=Aquincola agrisoli TaxID=3119538 RepID=A0AAW9QMA6_9BURK
MPPQGPFPPDRATRPAQLYGELARRLRDGRLPPGSRLTERLLSQEFGASRTVVREAVSKLQATGLVRSVRGVGTLVVEPQEAGMPLPILAAGADRVRLHELRAGFESEAAVLAARRRTTDDLAAMKAALEATGGDIAFHLAVARATHNPHYGHILARILSATGDDGHDPAAHEGIFRAIEQRDGDTARAYMRMHLAAPSHHLPAAQRG